MFRHLFRLFTAVPVTWTMLFVCGLIWAVDVGLSHRLRISFSQAQALLGAETPIGLWDGAWWTVITTAFHHSGALHLFLNTTCLWWLGRLLETRMGSWRYALFCLAGVVVSGGVQSIWGPYVGISGMLCAQLGLIWAWHKHDSWLQTYIELGQIHFMLIWVVLCLPITWLGLMPIGNAAHISGLFYGYMVGQIYFGSLRARSWRPAFLTAHFCLIPLFYFLVHPVWNGLYHWHMGDRSNNRAVRRYHFQNAILWDPSLEGPWLNLAHLADQEGKLLLAWDYVLNCLRHNPGCRPAIDKAHELWNRFPDEKQRSDAQFHLRKLFGAAYPNWEDKLLTSVKLIPLERIMNVLNKIPRHPIEKPETAEAPITLPSRSLEDIRSPEKKLPAPDPNSPGSAEEGRAA